MMSGYSTCRQLKVVTIEEIISHFHSWGTSDELEGSYHEIEESNQDGVAVTSNTQVLNTGSGSKIRNSEITSSYPTWSINGDFEVNIQEILSTYPVWSTHDGSEARNQEFVPDDQFFD